MIQILVELPSLTFGLQIAMWVFPLPIRTWEEELTPLSYPFWTPKVITVRPGPSSYSTNSLSSCLALNGDRKQAGPTLHLTSPQKPDVPPGGTSDLQS